MLTTPIKNDMIYPLEGTADFSCQQRPLSMRGTPNRFPSNRRTEAFLLEGNMKMTCTICKQTKPLIEFHKDKRASHGRIRWCKKCSNKWGREYRRQHPFKPWEKTLHSIKSRIGWNKHYIKRGIKNFLTLSDIKMIYERDRADLMKKPSIDRIDVKGDYSIDNCRYIEHSENSIAGGRVGGKIEAEKRWKDRIDCSECKFHNPILSHCHKDILQGVRKGDKLIQKSKCKYRQTY